jgi:hypothetical protein
MSIWILALVLAGVFAAIGYASGAIRTATMLVGVMVASFLTNPLAPKLTGLMPKIGIKHPLWVQFTPYIIVFTLIALVIFGIGFAFHHKVALIYKYKRDDFSRLKWERMNHHVGVSLGVVIALVIFFAIAKIALPAGYLTAQLSDDSNAGSNPGWMKFITAMRRDMQATGLDKSVSALDKTPPQFYDFADILGLIYHNPKVQSRLSNYPYFLGIGERPEFQEIAADKDYNEMLFKKEPFGTILNHPNTQRFIANSDLVNQFKGTDLKDLEKYLKTGKSKFDDQEIVGRWILDKDAILTFVRKSQPDLRGDQLVALKKGVELLPAITLVNTLENKTIVKAEGGGEAPPADPAAQPAPAAPDPSQDPRYQRMPQQQRGGQRPATPPPGAAAAAATAAAASGPKVIKLAGEGEWKRRDAGGYEITIADPSGKQQTLVANIQEDELTVTQGGSALVFYRAE